MRTTKLRFTKPVATQSQKCMPLILIPRRISISHSSHFMQPKLLVLKCNHLFLKPSQRFFATDNKDQKKTKSIAVATGVNLSSGMTEEKFQELATRIETGSNQLKKLFARIHPDIFHAHLNAKQVNAEAVRILNNLSGAMSSLIKDKDLVPISEMDSPLKLIFVCRKGDQTDMSLVKKNLFLPMEVRTIGMEVSVEKGLESIVRFYESAVVELIKELHPDPAKAKKAVTKNSKNTS